MSNIHTFIRNIQQRVGNNENITFDFFITFSRFEFALKHIGYAGADRRQNAMANWDKFANDFDNDFQKLLSDKKNKELLVATQYIFDNPPKRLKYSKSKLNWQSRDRIINKNLRELLLVVRGVRNNLFHGSKRLDIVEPSRNRDLLTHSMTILNTCLNFNRHLQEKYLEDLG